MGRLIVLCEVRDFGEVCINGLELREEYLAVDVTMCRVCRLPSLLLITCMLAMMIESTLALITSHAISQCCQLIFANESSLMPSCDAVHTGRFSGDSRCERLKLNALTAHDILVLLMQPHAILDARTTKPAFADVSLRDTDRVKAPRRSELAHHAIQHALSAAHRRLYGVRFTGFNLTSSSGLAHNVKAS